MIKRLCAATLLAVLIACSASFAAEKITYHHFDALGSPVAGTNEQGNIVWRETYQPYGERIQNASAAQANTRWYTGHPQDPETGLVYAGARYYDPVIGRFMAVDPRGFAESEPQSFNRYTYGNDNPYKYVDPDGRASATDLILIPVVIIGGAYIYYSAPAEQRQQMSRAVAKLLSKPIFGANSEPINVQNNLVTKNPFSGTPGTWSSDGQQDRLYGPDGWPAVDIDRGHDHNGAGDPHAHNWDRPIGGGRPTAENRGPAVPVSIVPQPQTEETER